MNKPTTVSEVYPTPYLKPEDLNGKRHQVVVHGVDVVQRRDYTGQQVWTIRVTWATVEGKVLGKFLDCNRTQARSLAQIAGTDVIARWPGTVVFLAAGRAMNGKPTIVITGE